MDEHVQEDFAAYFADKDVACPYCGYNLRGLTDEVCPECELYLPDCTLFHSGPVEQSGKLNKWVFLRLLIMIIIFGLVYLVWNSVSVIFFSIST